MTNDYTTWTVIYTEDLTEHAGIPLALERDRAGQDWICFGLPDQPNPLPWIKVPARRKVLRDVLEGRRYLESAIGNADMVRVHGHRHAGAMHLWKDGYNSLAWVPRGDQLRLSPEVVSAYLQRAQAAEDTVRGHKDPAAVEFVAYARTGDTESKPPIPKQAASEAHGYRYHTISFSDDSTLEVNPVPSADGESWLHAVVQVSGADSAQLLEGEQAERVRAAMQEAAAAADSDMQEAPDESTGEHQH